MDPVAWSTRTLMIIAVALQMVALTVAAPPADEITSLPGQPPVSFKQYSGYITVDKSHGRRLFYYFVEAVNSSATAPLVLWLNGGPACSSLVGAFSELGPFRPNASGTGLTLNDASWNQVANVIFLESPAGVGFSYSNDSSDYNTDDDKTAQDSLVFLLGWLAEYPEYNSADFYITGESYAGHYVPQLATAVLDNNKLAGQAQINLKGIMVGNPVFNNVIDLIYSVYEYGWGHGMVSEDTHDVIVRECNYSAPRPWSETCQNALADADAEIDSSQFLNQYDVLVDVCLEGSGSAQRLKAWKGIMTTTTTEQNTSWPPVDPCIDNHMTQYLNLSEVETAMHTEVSGWSECSKYNEIFRGIEDVLLIWKRKLSNSPKSPCSYLFCSLIAYTRNSRIMAPLLANLVNSSLRVWVYSGDADIVIPLVGTRKIVSDLAKTLKLKIKSTYQQWLQDCQIGGWTISWGSLVYSTVRGAGHMVPMFQPARALQLLSSFLAGDDGLPTDARSC